MQQYDLIMFAPWQEGPPAGALLFALLRRSCQRRRPEVALERVGNPGLETVSLLNNIKQNNVSYWN